MLRLLAKRFVYRTSLRAACVAAEESSASAPAPDAALTASSTPQVAFTTGSLARLADGAAVCSHGTCQVLATAVSERGSREDRYIDFLPLQVDHREKAQAMGRVPTTFLRRQLVASEREILTSRLVDRSVRPLFPDGFFAETQILSTLLANDGEMDSEVASVNAASAALYVSNVPWNGPVACVRVAMLQDGSLALNPTSSQRDDAKLDMLYTGRDEYVYMLEAKATGVTSEEFTEALRFASAHLQPTIDAQCALPQEKERFGYVRVPTDELMALAREQSYPLFRRVYEHGGLSKSERGSELRAARKATLAAMEEGTDPVVASMALSVVEKEALRDVFRETGRRVDGREWNELRKLVCEVGVLPVVHGSALFERGSTQSLATVTLGTPKDAQILERYALGRQEKHFMLHYEFPPSAVCETGRVTGLNRREVGHGTLAENAIAPMMPSVDEFPYAVRVNSDILMSDGSSSMASVCSGSLALMDAGVPLRAPVAGVSVGAIAGAPILDILGLEDGCGDMDFKVAGTGDLITAVQLDVKPKTGVPLSVLEEALRLSADGRGRILERMAAAIAAPRTTLRANAPVNVRVDVDRSMLGRIIGQGGRNVREIEARTNARISILDEEGAIHVHAPNQSAADEVQAMLRAAMATVGASVGEKYDAVVAEVHDFGAVVKTADGAEGLLHVSEIGMKRIQNPKEVLEVGQALHVTCIEAERGRFRFSLLSPEERKERKSRMASSRAQSPGASRGSRHSSQRRPSRDGRGASGRSARGERRRPASPYHTSQ